jgi:hypothetical protein
MNKAYPKKKKRKKKSNYLCPPPNKGLFVARASNEGVVTPPPNTGAEPNALVVLAPLFPNAA